MYYVYMLLYKNLAFYVGCTTNPIKRYKQHCGCNGWYTKNIIYPKIINGELPDFKIIYCNENKYEAKSVEAEVINKFAFNNHLLANLENNPIHNVIASNNLRLNISKYKLPKSSFYAIEKYFDEYKINNNEYVVDYSKINIKSGSYSEYGVWKRVKSTLYQQIKAIVSTLGVNEEAFLIESNRASVCAYIRQTASVGKKFITKNMNDQIKVIRIK